MLIQLSDGKSICSTASELQITVNHCLTIVHMHKRAPMAVHARRLYAPMHAHMHAQLHTRTKKLSRIACSRITIPDCHGDLDRHKIICSDVSWSKQQNLLIITSDWRQPCMKHMARQQQRPNWTRGSQLYMSVCHTVLPHTPASHWSAQ